MKHITCCSASLILFLALTGSYAHTQPARGAVKAFLKAKPQAALTPAAVSQLQRKIAFTSYTQLNGKTFLYSIGEMQRIHAGLMKHKNLSPLKAKQYALEHMPQLAAQYKIPALHSGNMLLVKDFTPLQIQNIEHLPVYPAELFPGDMARGMVLYENAAADLKEWFSKGLLAKRAMPDPWTKERTPTIHMINNTKIALKFARTDKPGVPAIVHISGFDGQANHAAETTQDIPADQIIRVSLLLNVDGKPTWGQIAPLGEGFVFLPYKNTVTNRLYNAALRKLYPDEK